MSINQRLHPSLTLRKDADPSSFSGFDIKEYANSVSVVWKYVTSNGEPKAMEIRMGKHALVGAFSKLEELEHQGRDMKVAFVKNRMFLRHADIWNEDRAIGGFVEWAVSMVPKYVKVAPRVVIAGNVEVKGYSVIDGRNHSRYLLTGIESLEGRYVIEGTDYNPITIEGPHPVTYKYNRNRIQY